METEVPSPPVLYFLERLVGAKLDVVPVNSTLPDWASMRIRLQPRMGWTSDGHSIPRRSSFGDGKLGFRLRSVVAADTRVLTVSEHIYIQFLPQCGPFVRVALAGVYLFDKFS